jgi:hypothetical protein
MRIKKEQSVSNKVLSVAEKLLENRVDDLRDELLEVYASLSKVTGKPVAKYLEQLQQSIAFRVRLLNGIRKRKVGRPRKEKVKTNGSK